MKITPVIALAPALVAAMPAPNPELVSKTNPYGVSVRQVTYGGSGCPQGSLKYWISDDGTQLYALFPNDFTATIGASSSPADQRKNCQINVDLVHSAGYQFTVASAGYAGHIAIDSGVQGTIGSTYYFSANTAQTTTNVTLNGAVAGDYLKQDECVALWSTCGTESMLNIDSQVALTAESDSCSGVLTMDRAGFDFSHVVYLKWRSC